MFVPLPKTRPPSINELRPISLTPTLAKIAEAFISKQLYTDIKSNIDPNQYGCLPGRSTTHCLVDVVNQLTKTSDKRGTVTTLVTTDFAKAFDRVDHSLAVSSLLELGLRSSLAKWICSFLTARQQRVMYKGVYSDWRETTCGLPQGTVLGPLIFLALINSANENSSARRWKFFDDLNLAESRMIGDTSTIQTDLNHLEQWATSRKMQLHPGKCKAMHVFFTRTPPPLPSLSIAGILLEEVKAVKLLGLHLQADLGWNTHVDHVVKQGSRKLFLLKQLKQFDLSRDDLLTCYKTFVRPSCEYAAPTWHPGLTTRQRHRIEYIQKRACRVILGSAYTSYPEACATLDLPTLEDRRVQLCLNFAMKVLRSQDFQHWLPPRRGSTTERTTRSSNKLTLTKCRTERYKQSSVPYMTYLLNSHYLC
ncbi:hypothetical protein Bbelb_393560 [Branchiostoma belcheri]|nr:hypothetical protein Bbelb_393560 [Branchiostoma belcheri]